MVIAEPEIRKIKLNKDDRYFIYIIVDLYFWDAMVYSKL